jgi:methyl-accepting chemotaxis protein
MTDDELRTLVASNAEATRELRATVERQAEASAIQAQGLASLRDSSESQARSIESMRESISYNTETMADSLELAASSQRTAAAAMETAAAAMELSASTSRNLDRLENDITDLKQIVGIVIRDNQADRTRISGLEGQS